MSCSDVKAWASIQYLSSALRSDRTSEGSTRSPLATGYSSRNNNLSVRASSGNCTTGSPFFVIVSSTFVLCNVADDVDVDGDGGDGDGDDGGSTVGCWGCAENMSRNACEALARMTLYRRNSTPSRERTMMSASESSKGGSAATAESDDDGDEEEGEDNDSRDMCCSSAMTVVVSLFTSMLDEKVSICECSDIGYL
jgi:hypothetical protein